MNLITNELHQRGLRSSPKSRLQIESTLPSEPSLYKTSAQLAQKLVYAVVERNAIAEHFKYQRNIECRGSDQSLIRFSFDVS